MGAPAVFCIFSCLERIEDFDLVGWLLELTCNGDRGPESFILLLLQGRVFREGILVACSLFALPDEPM